MALLRRAIIAFIICREDDFYFLSRKDKPMSYIDKNLLAGEQIIFRTKKHFIIFLMPMLWTLAAFLFLINSNPFVVKVAFLPAILAVFSWLNGGLIYLT